jgi:outer membrane protein assembly factor BamB
MVSWRRFAAAGVLVVAALAGCRVAQPGPVTPSWALPAVTGGGVRALWQGPFWEDLTISGGMVLGVEQDGHTARVHAVAALTGAPAWTMALPASLPQVLGLVPAGSVVVVEAGRGLDDPAGGAVVTEYVAVDVRTGHQVWTVPVRSGSHPLPDESPPIAAAGNLLLTGDPAGAVTAREAATGAVAWRDPRPAACREAPSAGMENDNDGLGVAADGALAVASFDCGPEVIVQRLEATTGKPLWSWTSPAASRASVHLPVTAAARGGGVVLLTGSIAPQPAAARFTAGLPHPYPWPARLGPADGESIVLALDAADGHPRWSELGGQQVTFTPADGAVCELVSPGLECRDDTTGAATLPDLMTGQSSDGTPMAGISGSVALVPAEPPRAGEITLRMVKIHGGATAAQARLAIGVNGSGTNLQVVPAAIGPLPGRATLLLINRVDQPGNLILALRIPGISPSLGTWG